MKSLRENGILWNAVEQMPHLRSITKVTGVLQSTYPACALHLHHTGNYAADDLYLGRSYA